MYSTTKITLRILILLGCLFSIHGAYAQLPVPFTIRYQDNLKGDMTMIANNIVNRDNFFYNTDDPYPSFLEGATANDNQTMRYIDIDGDNSTFSSSSATLTIPDLTCSRVVYAGLYWSATYRYNGSAASSGRDAINTVKLKLPGSATYTNITGTILFDGFSSADFSANSPYACYADVTSLLAGLASPNGVYTVANVRATQASLTGGISGGWNLFVVYENPKMPGRYITSYDGFAGVNEDLGDVDIPYSGFITVPSPLPVRAKLAAAALEGDRQITGDQLLFKAGGVASFSNLGNSKNPTNNFFSSTISTLDATNTAVDFTARVPNSSNTLGWDADIININDGLLPNGSTSATLQLRSTGDTYYMFFNALSVDIIEPDIQLIKTVQDIAGNDIAGADVTLGQVLDYVVSFDNVGNDNASSFTLRDVLPDNTFFTSVDVSGAPGTTYTYSAATGELNFTIPADLVEVSDPAYSIRIRVQIVSTCNELTNACSNLIQNQAYATYRGVLNNAYMITNDPSILGVDACGQPVTGPANFLVDIDDCTYTRTEVLCGASVQLTAGAGYASYAWYRENGVTDIFLGSTQSITVTSPGQYYVIDTPTPPCIGLTEYINVELFGTSQTNPVAAFADEVLICPNDGEALPEIFLCGLDDSRTIQTNVTDAQSIIWEKLNEASCTDIGVDGCANKQPTCQWTQVATGPNFEASEAGQYRLVINYQNGGCFSRFFFNVYKNNLDPQYTIDPIICNTPGNITVTNVPSTYEFRLINQVNNTVVAPYQASPVFSVATPGAYTVELRQQGVTDGCVFTLPNIGIMRRDIDVNTIITNTSCNGLGSIRLQALNVGPQYYYSIDGPSDDFHGPLLDNNHIFENLNPGTYTITVTTDDGCSFTDTVAILDQSNLTLTATVAQNVSCGPGLIQLTPSGGASPYIYAIYSYNGVLQNPDPGAFLDTNPVEIAPGQEGDYVFIMKDFNGCTILSNEVTIENLPEIVYTTSSQNVSCNGANDGSFTFAVTDTNGFGVSYELIDTAADPDVTIATNNTGIFTGLAAGTYTANLIQQGSETCSFPTNFTITEPTAVTVGTPTITQQYTCTTTASIELDPATVSGGTAPYQYSINGVTFGSATTFTGLTAGSYTVTVRDANGCTVTTTPVVIPALTPPVNINFTSTAVTCPALTSTVTLTVVGGSAPVNYAITAPSGSAVNNNNNNVFAGLSPGTYTFQVTDAKGCTYQESYTINAITPVGVDGVVNSNIQCFGGTNGSATFTVTGFSTNYNYSVTSTGTAVAPVNNATAGTIQLTNLAAGTYTITVTDNTTNCTATDSVTIQGAAAALTLPVPAVSPITCAASGSATATATGGWGSYQYTLTQPNGTTVGPQSNAVFGNLVLGGSYTLEVTDANGCTASRNFSLAVPTAPVATIAPASDICYDANAASLSVNVTGGLAPFAYSINGGAYQASDTFAGLTPGTYTITVRDANNCTATVNRTINAQLAATAVLEENLDCSADPDAQIEVTIVGGATAYTYQVSYNGGAYGTSSAVTGSSIVYETTTAGTYRFQVTDAAGCVVQTNTITVNPLLTPAITSAVAGSPILCNGGNTGSINVVVDPATVTGPYTLNVVNTTTPQNFGTQTTGLTAGTYSITVRDNTTGCVSAVANVIITQPDAIDFNINAIPITCNSSGVSAGEIIVEDVTGGTGAVTYYLTNNFGYNVQYVAASREDHSFTVLNYGIYQVVVEDANGCTTVQQNIVMASPPEALDITIDSSVVSCAAGGTARITVGATITSNNYEFGILQTNVAPYLPPSAYQPADNPSFPRTSTFTGLIPGVTYTFVVHDLTTNCYYLEAATIPDVTASTLTVAINTVNDVTCTGAADGSVIFTFNGYGAGATAINYQVYNAQSNTPVAAPGTSGSTPVTTGPESATLNTLAPGTYYILLSEVGGANDGCRMASTTFTISQSVNELEVTAVVTKNDNCNSNAGIITATGQFGTAPYQYQIVASGGTPSGAGWNIPNVFNVEGGSYDVYIRDANNCIRFDAITLPTDATPVITASISNQCTTPEGGFAIQVNRTVDGIAPYSYSIDGGVFYSEASASFTISNLSSGAHTIQIRDANGCGNTVNVDIESPLSATSSVVAQPTCANNDGSVSIAAAGGSGAFEYELQDTANTILAGPQPGAVFAGLPAGDYIVLARDTNTGCTVTAAVSLAVPTPVSFITSFEDVSCNNGSDGTITIALAASNDNPPYTFTVDDGVNTPVTQASPVFTGLEAGTYTVTVTSGQNCSDTATVTIAEPAVLTNDATATAFACAADNTVNTSTVTITAGGGTAPYSYSIDGTNYFATNTFEVVDTGMTQNVTTYVKDSNNCITTDAVSIAPLPALTAITATQVTAITCTNSETVAVAVTGGSGNYTFEMLPSGPVQNTAMGVASAQFTLTAPGTYTFRVTDDVTGCSITTTTPYEINVFDTIEAVASAPTPVTCFGGTDGTITIDVTGYTGNYNYQVSNAAATPGLPSGSATAGTPVVITGMPAGNYFVTVTATGTPFCSADSNTITVPSPASALTLDATEVANVTCSNNQGAIFADASGGWGTLEYQLLNITTATVVQAYSPASSFTGLPAGNYRVSVRDAGGCIVTDDVNLVQPAAITATINTSATQVLCYNDNTVTVSATGVSGGQGDYLYILNTYDSTGTTIVLSSGVQTTPVFDNLGAGIYSITITDSWCELTTNTVTITEPAPLEGYLSLTDGLTCTTQAGLTVSAAGGTAPYQFSTDGITYSGVNTFTVGAGTYQYYVQDSNGCTAVMTNAVTVLPVPPLQLDLDLNGAVINCSGGATASIVADAVGGLGNYTYELLDGSSTVIEGPQTDETFAGLTSGTYYVRVISGDCSATSSVINIAEPDPLVINAVKNDISCFNAENGSIIINATGGTGTIQYAITPNLNQFDTDNTFTGLSAGTYQVIIQDQNGCFELRTFTIVEPQILAAIFGTTIDEVCLGAANGELTVNITGGTGDYEVNLVRMDSDGNTTTGPYIQVTGSQYTFENLTGDALYQINIRDTNGCNVNPPLEHYMAPPVEVIPSATVDYNCTNNVPGNTVTVGVNTEVVNDVQYSLDNVAYQTSNTFTNLTPGNYTAYVRHTNGCVQTDTFTIDNLVPVAATAAVASDVLCFGGTTGAIEVTATGGTGALEYAISPSYVYGTSNTFTGLTAGNYTVRVQDEIGCIFEIPNVTVIEPAAALAATVTGTHEICINANDGTISIAVSGGTAPYSTSIDGTTYTQGQFSYTGLADGTYTVYVTDANGCTITPQTFTVNPGVDIQPDAQVDPTCTANVPGNVVTVSVNASVGGSVEYSLDGIAYQTSNTFTNLTPGNYTAYVRHTNGCVQTDTFTIDNLIPVAATAAVTSNVLCFGGTTGAIEVTATGGTGVLEYAISPSYVYGTSNTFTGLAAGNYTVRVQDEIGCILEITNVTVTEPAAALAATVTGTPEICINANDGTISIAVSGGTAPYSTSIDGTTYTQGQFSYTGLADGTYTVYVTDANGCTITPQTFTVNPGVDIQPDAVVTDNCTNNVPGNVVTVNLNPAVASEVEYSLDGVTYQIANTFTNLAAGNYTAYVRHTNGCVQTDTFTIDNLVPVAATAAVTSNVLCFGGTTGAIEVTATGGTGALEYAISPSFVYGTSNTFTGLAAGNYTVRVQDEIGCIFEITNVTVTEPAAALAATVTGTPEICINANDGTISIAVSGGTAPYSTSIDGITYTQGQFSYTGLADGTYTVYVTDANGCTITPQIFTVNPGVDIQPDAQVDPTCTANVPGNVVTVNVNASVAGSVEYSLDGIAYQTSNTFTNIAPGNYTAYVRHTNGCIATDTFTIDNLVPVAATAAVTSNVLCFGGTTGAIEVTATGGTGALEYAISPSFVYGTSNTFTGLAAGNYTVRVQDEIGCIFEIPNVTVTEPAAALAATVTGTPEICINANDGTISIAVSGGTAPYSISIDGTTYTQGQFSYTGLADSTYTVYVTDANGCAITPQTFTVNPGVDIQPDAVVTDNCTNNVPGNVVTVNVNASVAGSVEYSLDGIAYQISNTFTNLVPGNYTVYVRHSNGCIATDGFTIDNLVPVAAMAAVTSNVLCFGGTTGAIEVTATGGTGVLEYAISPSFVYGTSNTFTGLTAGNYTVRVQDEIGCIFEIPNVTVTEPAAALAATVTGTPEICINANDGTISIAVTGGTAPYSTSIDGTTYTQGQFSYTGLADGTYTVYVTDANGCTITPQTFTVNPGVDIQPDAQVDPTCTANVPGNVVTVNVNPAVASEVEYSLDGVTYQIANTFTNLAPGNYTVYVRHSNGCIAEDIFEIENLLPIDATVTVTADVVCFGDATGEITVTATGGTGTLEYAISPDYIYSTSNVFTGLAAGTYTVRVQDEIGCIDEELNIGVDGPTVALTADVTATPEICLDANDGTITIAVTGGTAPYSTSIDGTTYAQDQFSYAGLADGTYTVYVTDANGCTFNEAGVVIGQGVNFMPVAQVTPTCTGNTPGNVVTVTVNQEVEDDVEYSLDGVTYQDSNTFTNLAPGNYTVYVQHVDGCIQQTASFEIEDLQPITATAQVTDITCFGEYDGIITITATGGTGTLEYGLSPLYTYGSSNTFTQLAAGNYNVRVRDDLGCIVNIPVTIVQPAEPLAATVTGTPETCLGLNDGSLSISVTGGVGPYWTSLNTFNPDFFQQDVYTYENLVGGDQYVVYVKDANGCQIGPLFVVIEEGVVLKPRVDVAYDCVGNVPGNAVTVTVEPGLAAETEYSLDDITYQASNVFTDLAPGTHTVYSRHINGCVMPVTFIIQDRVPVAATAVVTDALCNGGASGTVTVTATGGLGEYLYGVSPDFDMTADAVLTGLTAGTYTVRVEDSAGCFTLLTNVVIGEPSSIVIDVADTMQEICAEDNNGAIEIAVSGGTAPYAMSLDANGPFVDEQYLFENLDGGQTYTVYVRDANNCIATRQVQLDDPIDIDAQVDVQYDCQDNTAIISVDPSVAANVTYSLNGGAAQASNEFRNLPNGNYTVDVVHAAGCTDSVTFTISNGIPLTLSVTETGLNQLTATAGGGTGGYNFTFNEDDNGSSNTYVFYESGTIVVTVTDSSGCRATVSIDVVFVEISIPDVITPDGNGQNDTWSPGNTDNYPNISTDIFDRYGRKLATLRQGQTWDATYNGYEMPTGDYWYVIKLGNPEHDKEFVGHFTIYR